jgi:hypothetical protein
VPGELYAPPGLGGFEDPGIVFLVLRVGDSSPIGTFCAKVLGLMSLGTLHSQVRNGPRIKESKSCIPIRSVDRDFFSKNLKVESEQENHWMRVCYS